MNKRAWVIGMLLAGLMFTTGAEAAMVMPFNVEEMTQRAEKIFVGTCTKVEHTVNAQGMPVVEVSFAVSETLKGEVGDTVTFRQIDPAPQRQTGSEPQSGSRFRVRGLWSAAVLAGVPAYAPGEKALLFLAREGQLGLTAPVGLLQGKMPVTTTASGKKLVTNSALKRTERVDLALPEPGKAGGYDQFVTTIRAIVQPAQ